VAILRRARAIAALGALVVVVHAPARSASLTEAQVKAGVLCNLAAFVEWPAEPAARTGVVVIGVAGPDPVFDALARARGRTVNGRSIVPRDLGPGDDPRDCHILFIPQSPQNMTSAVLVRAQGAPVLTVGEEDDFTRKGGVVRLLMVDGRVRLEVNVAAASRADLRISSKMLSLARIVGGGPHAKD